MSLGFEEISNYLIKEVEENPDYFYDKMNLKVEKGNIDVDDIGVNDVEYIDKNNFRWKRIVRDGMEIFGIDVKFKGLYEYPEEISEYLPDEIINDELEMKSVSMEQLLEEYNYELGVLGRSGGYWGIDLNNEVSITDLLEFVVYTPSIIDNEYLIEEISNELSGYIENLNQIDVKVAEYLDINNYDNRIVEWTGLEDNLDDYDFTDKFKKCANEFTDKVKYFESKESMLNFLNRYSKIIPELKQYLNRQKQC